VKKIYLLTILILSCNPERDNPYDPLSPNYTNKGKIEGKVKTRRGTPIEGVKIYTQPKKYFTLTNKEGKFELELDKGEWGIIGEKEGFTSETLKVKVEVGRVVSSTFILNALPQVVSCKITSFNSYIGYPIGSKYWADITAQVQDEDGLEDIDSIWVTVTFNSSKFLKFPLFYISLDTYGVMILGEHCPGGNLETLIGKPFKIEIKDKAESRVSFSPFYMTRIIYPIPHTISPYSNEEIKEGVEVKFVWEKIYSNFEVDYQFYVIEYWSRDTVYKSPILLDSVYTTPPFSRGEYYWKVMAKDEYGNKVTSRATGFTVVPSK
jgi:hypothetical protein